MSNYIPYEIMCVITSWYPNIFELVLPNEAPGKQDIFIFYAFLYFLYFLYLSTRYHDNKPSVFDHKTDLTHWPLGYIIYLKSLISQHVLRNKFMGTTYETTPRWMPQKTLYHDDVIKWKHFPRYWLFARGIHRSAHKGQRRGALVFSLICAWINSWVNNREAGDLRRHRAPYDVSVMW